MWREPLFTLPDSPCADVVVATMDAPLRDEVAMRLSADGCRVREVGDEQELLDLLSTGQEMTHQDLVVADARSAGPVVRKLLSELRQAGTPVLLIGEQSLRPAGAVAYRTEANADDVCRLAARFLDH